MNTLKKTGLILVALFLALLLVGLTATAANPAPSDFRFRVYQMSPSYLAYTECHQIGNYMSTVSWLRTEVLEPDSLRALLKLWGKDTVHVDQENPIVAHEHKHKEQMRRFPNCRAAYEGYRDNRIELEAEAYCSAAQVYHREHPKETTLDGAIYQYAQWLKNYDPHLTLGEAVIAIKEYCN